MQPQVLAGGSSGNKPAQPHRAKPRALVTLTWGSPMPGLSLPLCRTGVSILPWKSKKGSKGDRSPEQAQDQRQQGSGLACRVRLREMSTLACGKPLGRVAPPNPIEPRKHPRNKRGFLEAGHGGQQLLNGQAKTVKRKA